MTMERTNEQQQRLITLLSNGGKYSVIAIANALHIGDPRSVIRNLRKSGVKVSDEWVTTKDGRGKYKRYFIAK